MKISVLQNSITKDFFIERADGITLLDFLSKEGFVLNAYCGGKGICGKCKVEILLNGEKKVVSACKTALANGMCVLLEDTACSGLTETDGNGILVDKREGFGAVLDLGTTTLAFALIDLTSGSEIEKISMLNPQVSFGADVISRIAFSKNGNLVIMQKAILNATESVLKRFCSIVNKDKLESLFVSGNTTMLNIFAGEDVTGIGVAPYTAKILQSTKLNNLPLSVKETILMPSANAFVGGDAIVGAISVDIEKGNNIFVDIGTNGEIIVSNKGKYYCTSTAAGPCFEGAKIECGMGGTAGAIDHVWLDNGICFSTIENKSAKGICGSGLIDAIAIMLKGNVIDQTGACSKEKFYISSEVYITDKDVREFQLAKSAISSGIDVLMSIAGLKEEDVDNVFVAGGLGFYLNKENAVLVGLLPKGLSSKIKVVGNSSLKGAKSCLLNKTYLDRSIHLAKKVQNVDLSTKIEFNERFMENMFFGDDNYEL